MVKITERSYEATGRPAFICDFSPPRSPNLTHLPQPPLDADFLLVAYNPGRAVRVNSAMLAAHIRQSTGVETAFTLVTRDMNRLALQSHLLGRSCWDCRMWWLPAATPPLGAARSGYGR